MCSWKEGEKFRRNEKWGEAERLLEERRWSHADEERFLRLPLTLSLWSVKCVCASVRARVCVCGDYVCACLFVLPEPKIIFLGRLFGSAVRGSTSIHTSADKRLESVLVFRWVLWNSQTGKKQSINHRCEKMKIMCTKKRCLWFCNLFFVFSCFIRRKIPKAVALSHFRKC